MKQTRVFAKATVTAKAERSIEIGHPWVYDTEVVSAENGVENGGLVDVVSKKGNIWAPGFSVSGPKSASGWFPATQTTGLTGRSGNAACAMRGSTVKRSWAATLDAAALSSAKRIFSPA